MTSTNFFKESYFKSCTLKTDALFCMFGPCKRFPFFPTDTFSLRQVPPIHLYNKSWYRFDKTFFAAGFLEGIYFVFASFYLPSDKAAVKRVFSQKSSKTCYIGGEVVLSTSFSKNTKKSPHLSLSLNNLKVYLL